MNDRLIRGIMLVTKLMNTIRLINIVDIGKIVV